MRNKIVGYVVIGLALLIGFIVFSFNRAMNQIVGASCGHGASCPMWGSIGFQTTMGLVIMAIVVAVGIYLVLWGDVKPRKVGHKILKELTAEERKLMHLVKEAEGTIFQSDLVEKTDFDKVKVTRLLDRLEGRGLIERKRRGMTNVVILKH